MLPNFIAYMKCEYEKHGLVLEELGNLRFTNSKPVYSANLIRYACVLRYSSLSAFKLLLTEINLPSISFLRKVTSGKLDSIASVNSLKIAVEYLVMRY